MGEIEKYLEWKDGQEKSFNENSYDYSERRKQIRKTILKSIKEANKKGFLVNKSRLITACIEDFPVNYDFVDNCIKELIFEKKIKIENEELADIRF